MPLFCPFSDGETAVTSRFKTVYKAAGVFGRSGPEESPTGKQNAGRSTERLRQNRMLLEADAGPPEPIDGLPCLGPCAVGALLQTGRMAWEIPGPPDKERADREPSPRSAAEQHRPPQIFCRSRFVQFFVVVRPVR